MRLNENTIICGDRLILVPYRAEHVPTYHEWMKSPELLELTASEPLSLEEEYDMQRKWHLDEDKLTFILLARPVNEPSPYPSSTLVPSPSDLQNGRYRMVGDVNMFLPNGLDEDGECEIMIASQEDRRKGYAKEALQLFLSYATAKLPLPPTHLIARIGSTNQASIKLFESLGFKVTKVVEVFDEVEMRWSDSPDGDALPRRGFEVSLEGRIGVYDP